MKKEQWRKWTPSIIHPESDCFYQELIVEIGDTQIYANLVEWTIKGVKGWDLDIQIPEEVSITGKTINTLNFNYDKLDFARAKKDAKKTIKALIK